MDDEQSPFDLEIELLQSSLLGNEKLTSTNGDSRVIEITSSDSKLALHVVVAEGYPRASSVQISIKGPEIHRDEAEDWKTWVEERMTDWDETDE